MRKKMQAVDYAKIAAVIIGAFILSTAVFFLIAVYASFLSNFSFVIAFGIFYFAYRLIKNSSIEFEYALTNEELDVDKIMAASSRKRMITVNCREIEVCANVHDKANFVSAGEKEVLNYCGDINAENVYFIDFYQNDKNTRMIFQPSEKMIKSIKMLSPSKVHLYGIEL
ncbi:MAG: hypothetical protein Q4B31_04455 [Clostridia bacterium]|nr:hypothetical protein [Clostridia bacterium]